MKQKTHKALAMIIALIVLSVTVLPFAASDIAFAAGPYDIAEGNIAITWVPSGWQVNGVLVANSESDPIVITGTTDVNVITVDGSNDPAAAPVYIQFNNLSATYPSYTVTPVTVRGGASVFLSLIDDNNLLTSATNFFAFVGMHIMPTTDITINGPGMLATGRIGTNINNSLGCGSITINSGTIKAEQGIGGGDANPAPLTINGGTITADYLIGSYAYENDITITGGSVTANSGICGGKGDGVITITGGTIVATGSAGQAGIGSCAESADAGAITISGDAIVSATGGSDPGPNGMRPAAGIGNGAGSSGGTIIISGNATVVATGGSNEDGCAAGIGNGCVSASAAADTNITITDGATVTARAGQTVNPSLGVNYDIGGLIGEPYVLDIDGGALVTLEEFGAQPSNSNFIGECVIIDNNTADGYTNLTGTYYSLSVTDGTADFTSDSYRKAGIVKSGNPVTLTADAAPLPGEAFDKWVYAADTASGFAFKAGNSAASDPAVIIPNHTGVRPATFKLAFAATFAQPAAKYTVTIDSQGGTPVAPIKDVAAGSTITAPTAPTRPGYTFAGWYQDAAGTDPWTFATDTVNSTITLYAKWTPVQTTPASTPKTGDDAHPALWITLSGATLVWMAAAVVLRKRNRLLEK